MVGQKASRGHQQALWDHFKHHHYKSHELNVACHSRVAPLADGTPVAFVATMPAPGIHEVGLSYALSRTV